MSRSSSSTSKSKKLINELKSHKGPIHTSIYSNKGSGYLLTGGQDRLIKLWKPTNKGADPIKTYEGHGYEVLGITCSPDNKQFASCGGDKTVFLFDTTAGIVNKKFLGHNGKVNAVCFNEDASILASGSFDTTVRLWDMKSQQRMPLQILEEGTDSITSIAISDHLIVTGSVDGYVRTYDIRKGELRTDYFEYPIASITLSSDSSMLLLSTLDSKIRTMDLQNGKLFNTYTGHKNSNYRSKVSFGGVKEDRISFGDEEGVVREWDVESGKMITDYQAHDRTILWTAHHPTENQLVTASSDGTVKVWG